MNSKIEFRKGRKTDLSVLERLYMAAFPDEDLIQILRDIMNASQSTTSIVALRNKDIVGHIGFTYCKVGTTKGSVALLAPLAVSPSLHKQGIGSALIQMGFRDLEASNIEHVYVLGNPNYYGRFGFKREDGVTPPYPLPEQWQGAWQSYNLGAKKTIPAGMLTVPSFWQKEALWTDG